MKPRLRPPTRSCSKRGAAAAAEQEEGDTFATESAMDDNDEDLEFCAEELRFIAA
jgi:hypothetical protein